MLRAVLGTEKRPLAKGVKEWTLKSSGKEMVKRSQGLTEREKNYPSKRKDGYF